MLRGVTSFLASVDGSPCSTSVIAVNLSEALIGSLGIKKTYVFFYIGPNTCLISAQIKKQYQGRFSFRCSVEIDDFE